MHLSKTFTFVLLLIVIAAVPVFASDPIVWDTGSRAELLKGEARGISINDAGIITLAPEATQVFNTEQPYVWSSAIDSAGNVYLGTGHDGKVFRFGMDGKGSLLFKASELDVTALAIAKDGSIFAATSPDGKVYRITTDGKSAVYFDPEDKYIWSLAILNDGSLAVGTGDNGKLYRVRTAGAKSAESLLVDTNQTHVMSLAVTARGDLIAGTDPGGVVLRISSDGKAFALYDAPLREIHALAAAPDGSIYALGLGESAATTKAAATDATSAAAAVVSVTTDESAAAQAAPTPARSRNDLTNARTAVFHILPDGGTDIVWSSTTVTGFAVMATRGGVLIGTSDKGRIYSVTDSGRDTLLLQTTEGQVSSLMSRGSDVFAASSNQGKLIRFGATKVKDGSYESPVRDARLFASWGKIWWRGAGPIALQTRSGNSERPDMTWSDWSASYTDASGGQISSPRARFIQWRAILKSDATANREDASLDNVSLAYLPRNVAPEVVAITVLPPGVALQQQVQMPVDPNIEASGLDASMFGFVTQAPPRRLFQRGARSLQWQSEDRNGDTLEYAVYYRALNESTFRLLKDHIRETFYTVDGASLADGQYVFRIVASDDLDNPAAMALSADRISEPVDIDNTPPVLRSAGQVQVTGDRVRAVFDVADATGRIKRADVSIDGSPWREVFPDDGIADGGKERYSLDLNIVGPGEHTISLRAFDNSNNGGNISVSFRR
jgi:sugar lactone lactonase YvrE